MKKIFSSFVLLSFFSLFFVNINIAQTGVTCAEAQVITALPFLQAGLATAADNYDVLPCATGMLGNYISGNDYIFTYTPLVNETVTISLANTNNAAAIFVTDACPDVATACIGSSIESLTHVVSNLALNAGTPYYFTISSLGGMFGAQAINFDIDITICSAAPVASFIYLDNDTIVSFTNTSTDGVSYEWLFGDEVIHNWLLATADVSPVHSYPGYGTYTVEMVATNSCGSTDTVTQIITLLCPGNLPVANFTYSDLGGGVYTFLSSSTDAISYEWFIDYPPGFLPAQYTTENTNHTFLADGIYTVYLIVNNPCGSDTLITDITVIGVKIDAINNNYSVKCYPNPVRNMLTVDMNNISAGTKLSFVNILGTELSNETIEASGTIKKQFDVSSYAKGIYFLKIDGNNGTNVIRFVVE